MSTNDTWLTSRRAVLKSGVVSTGALIGASTAGGATSGSSAERNDPDGEDDPPLEGAMFPYQVVTGRAATVVETDIGWHPTGVADTDRSHVVAYDHAPSLRAFFFADEALEPGSSVELGSITDVRSSGTRVVTVGCRTDE